MVQNSIFEAFFLKSFSRGLWQAFSKFFVFFRCIERLFFDNFFEKCGLISKSADPGFLHTVQRFGLISKVLGLLKHGKNSKKGVLEIMVF